MELPNVACLSSRCSLLTVTHSRQRSSQVPGRGKHTAISEGMHTTIFGKDRKGLRQVQCPVPPLLLEVRTARVGVKV